MHGIKSRNPAAALPHAIAILENFGVAEETRAGTCLVAPGPVITITDNPMERVLFSAARDANPFFHLVEALWMLSGSNNVKPLLRYVKDFGERFAEPGGDILHGAYGHRWRKSLGFDQLNVVVEKLRKDLGSRQAVIQMWDSSILRDEERGYGHNDLMCIAKDRPCNTHIYLRVRKNLQPKIDAETPQTADDGKLVLDLTVCCRSNDAIWGAHGANAVHFSVLQEYLAARIGVDVGRMYQFSNNYHAYVSELDRLRDRVGRLGLIANTLAEACVDDRYESLSVSASRMFDHPYSIDEDVRRFFEWHDQDDGSPSGLVNRWFETTAVHVVRAHRYHREKNYSAALLETSLIQSTDWRQACQEWISRRFK